MEINAENVAWRNNFFVGSQAPSAKKIRELWTEEIQEITDNAIPVTTKKTHKVRNENIQGTYPFKFPLKAVKFQKWTSRFYSFMKIT